MRHFRSFATTTIAACVLAGANQSSAQTAPLTSEPVRVNTDSGVVTNTHNTPGFSVVYSTVVTHPGATWLRLYFGDVVLAGNMFDKETGSYLRITSMADGAVQRLDARSIKHWSNSSAYFNGDSVVVELLAVPGTGPNRIVIDIADAGVFNPNDSICGATDDRQLSSNPSVARLMPIGCSVFLLDDAAKCFLTAGHCIDNGNTTAVAHFNVPLSTSTGGLVMSSPDDQYPVDSVSIQSTHIAGSTLGNDYAFLGFHANSNTGLTAYEAQISWPFGVYPAPVTTTFPPTGAPVTVTGYGNVSLPVSLTWNHVQKTHVGPMAASTPAVDNILRYTVDTTGGNSGSPIYSGNGDFVIGIHTHGGCNTSGFNHGTAVSHPGILQALAAPQGVCVPQALGFSYPSPPNPNAVPPTTFNATGGDTVTVVVHNNGGHIPEPGTGMLHYDDGSGITSVSMAQVLTDGFTVTYRATLPPAQCGTLRDFFFSADAAISGATYTDPPNAPVQTYTATSISSYTADCDSSGALNILDYICFGNAYALGDPYADCDGSGSLNILDFICYGNVYTTGCP